MHDKLITILLTVTLALAIAPQSQSAQQKHYDDSDMPEREEIHQTYELAPGARIEVSTIAGSVDVEASDGSTAEVRIIRKVR